MLNWRGSGGLVVFLIMMKMMMMMMKWRPDGVIGKGDLVVLAMSPVVISSCLKVPCVQHEDIEVLPCNGQARQSKNQTTEKGSWEHLESSN